MGFVFCFLCGIYSGEVLSELPARQSGFVPLTDAGALPTDSAPWLAGVTLEVTGDCVELGIGTGTYVFTVLPHT